MVVTNRRKGIFFLKKEEHLIAAYGKALGSALFRAIQGLKYKPFYKYEAIPSDDGSKVAVLVWG